MIAPTNIYANRKRMEWRRLGHPNAGSEIICSNCGNSVQSVDTLGITGHRLNNNR